jgi:hypothetical protein
MNIDKNFSTSDNIKKSSVFVPIYTVSVPKKVDISTNFKSAKPVTRKKQTGLSLT